MKFTPHFLLTFLMYLSICLPQSLHAGGPGSRDDATTLSTIGMQRLSLAATIGPLTQCSFKPLPSNPIAIRDLKTQTINNIGFEITSPRNNDKTRFHIDGLDVFRWDNQYVYFQRVKTGDEKSGDRKIRMLYQCNLKSGVITPVDWILPRTSKTTELSRQKWLAELEFFRKVSTFPDKTGLIETYSLAATDGPTDGIIDKYYEFNNLDQALNAKLDPKRFKFESRLFSVFKQIAKGVKNLHEHGIVHSDINPRNIRGTLGLGSIMTVAISNYEFSFDVSDTGNMKPKFGGDQWWVAPEVYFGATHNIYSDPNTYKLRDVYSMAAMLAFFVKPQLYPLECRSHVNKLEINNDDIERMQSCLRLAHDRFKAFVTSNPNEYGDALTALILDGLEPDPLKRINSTEWLTRLEAIQ